MDNETLVITKEVFDVFFTELFAYEEQLLESGKLVERRAEKIFNATVNAISRYEEENGAYLKDINNFVTNILEGRIFPKEFFDRFAKKNPSMKDIQELNAEISMNGALISRLNAVKAFFSDKTQSDESAALSTFISQSITEEEARAFPSESSTIPKIEFPLLRVSPVDSDFFPTENELHQPISKWQLGYKIDPYNYDTETSFNSSYSLKQRYDELRVLDKSDASYKSELAPYFKDVEQSLHGSIKNIFDLEIPRVFSSDYPLLQRPEMPFFFTERQKNDILELSLRKKIILLTRAEISRFFEEFKKFAATTHIDWYSKEKLDNSDLEIFENNAEQFCIDSGYTVAETYRFKNIFIEWIVAKFILPEDKFADRCTNEETIPIKILTIFEDSKTLRNYFLNQRKKLIENDKRFLE